MEIRKLEIGIEKKNKRGEGMSLGKIISLILVVAIVFLIAYGTYYKLFGPIINKVSGFLNYVMSFLKPAEPEPISETVKVNILGKEREVIINDGNGKCVVDIKELGKFSLDFKTFSMDRKIRFKLYGGEHAEERLGEDAWEPVTITSSEDPFIAILGGGNNVVDYSFGYGPGTDANYIPVGWKEYESPEIRRFLNQEMDKLFIDVDGEKWKVLFIEDGLFTKVENDLYIYYPDGDNKLQLKFYNNRNKEILDIPADKFIESQKVREGFEKLMQQKVEYDGKQRSLFFERPGDFQMEHPESYEGIKIIFGFNYDYYKVGTGTQIWGRSTPPSYMDNFYVYDVLFRKFTVPRADTEKALDEIRNSLNKTCR